ncbi:zeta toxin family protein [Brevundimonas sp.]|uniref:zeta toxin family protein n=1 Tax=Brevundimonas sp. TaxID=1871086 RepID=UPI002AB89342|nr:zeta toxin family protein [Brevundimonas sp.]MDZ4363791.1 zeta toxin family protein [Brevundimonas sp.]
MASQPRSDSPALWIIAGPNGSGKSSAYGLASVNEPAGSIWIINPDLLTTRIAEQEKLDRQTANIASVQRIEAWLYASVETHQTIGVETVLSTPKYRALVEHAKSRGFNVKLIYVFLESSDLNVQRVKTRARKGGHDVPEEKIRSRRLRSFKQFGWFFQNADSVDVYDNSGATPRRILAKRGLTMVSYERLPEEMIASVEVEDPGFRSLYDKFD